MTISTIPAGSLLSTQRYLRERNKTLIRAKPFHKDSEDFYLLMYI